MTPITLESSAKTWWEANNQNLAQELYESGAASHYPEETGYWIASVSTDGKYELTVCGSDGNNQPFEFTVPLVNYQTAWKAYAAWKEYTDAGKWLGVSK